MGLNADPFGPAAAVYGLSPIFGRLYCTLLLSPQPMSLDQLVAAVTSTWPVLILRQCSRTGTGSSFSTRSATPRKQNAQLRAALRDNTTGPGWPSAEDKGAILERLEVAAVPRVRFLDLRHTHAILMLSEGVHPKIVSERLGHANIGITLDTYSHVLPAYKRKRRASLMPA